jgi:hypothetical protein
VRHATPVVAIATIVTAIPNPSIVIRFIPASRVGKSVAADLTAAALRSGYLPRKPCRFMRGFGECRERTAEVALRPVDEPANFA